ncbi:MAG: hypothetical protein CSA49_03225 [Gammaproteobacteria bacterium]|nr:MAG: hypothetical protein CSA49_03225 [Gammaproteobacteria bacterium]
MPRFFYVWQVVIGSHMNKLEIVSEKLKSSVPMVRHMQIDVVEYRPGYVVVEAPFEPNINTHGTAFGGSLYCVATLCGWSLLYLTLLDAGFDPDVWVTKGEIEYFVPVRGTLRAVVNATDKQCAELVNTYREKGRTRAEFKVEIYNQEELALTLNACYAAR